MELWQSLAPSAAALCGPPAAHVGLSTKNVGCSPEGWVKTQSDASSLYLSAYNEYTNTCTCTCVYIYTHVIIYIHVYM